jgi:hypothetical protein
VRGRRIGSSRWTTFKPARHQLGHDDEDEDDDDDDDMNSRLGKDLVEATG